MGCTQVMADQEAGDLVQGGRLVRDSHLQPPGFSGGFVFPARLWLVFSFGVAGPGLPILMPAQARAQEGSTDGPAQ